MAAKKPDGKQLERVVSYIESLSLPPDWTITPNVRTYTSEGKPSSELDIVVEGRAGTMDFKWLIECRDRPSEGAAPVSWIEQLVTRKQRLKFSQLTAVSTTGFSAAALEEAERSGIDTRQVKELSPSAFKGWPELVGMPHRTEYRCLRSVGFLFGSLPPAIDVEAVNEILNNDLMNLSLINLNTGTVVTPRDAFTKILSRQPELLSELRVNGPLVPVCFNVKLDEPHALETPQGRLTVEMLRFTGSVLLTEEHMPLAFSGEYSRSPTGETISRLRMFEPLAVLGLNLQTEIHESPDIPGSTIVFRSV